MPFNPETGEWEDEPYYGQQSLDPDRELTQAEQYAQDPGTWTEQERGPTGLGRYVQPEESYPPPPQGPPPPADVGYSPTSEQEFRRASMANQQPRVAGVSAVAPGGPRIFNRVEGPPTADGQEAMVEDTRGAVNFRPYEQGGQSGTIEGQGVDWEEQNQQRAAYFQRREAFPEEAPQRTQEMLAAQRQGLIQPNFSPEQALAQTEARIAAATPSTAERMSYQRLQNGMAAVQQAVTSGQITPEAGGQMMRSIGQQMQPTQIRLRDLPGLIRQQQFRHNQLVNARLEGELQAGASFAARSMQDRTRHVTTPDGGTVTIIENGGGRPPTIIDRPRQEAAQRPAITDQMRTNAVNAATRNVDTRNAATLTTPTPEARAAAIEQEARQHLEILGRLQGGGDTPAEQAGSGPTQPPATRPREAAVLTNIRATVENHPNAAVRGNATIQASLTRLQALISQPQLSEAERREIGELDASISRAIRNVNTPVAPTPAPARSVMPFGSQQPGFIGGR